MSRIIGVLALQGSVKEHLEKLSLLENIISRQVRNLADLTGVDALIIPGGESTTIRKLLDIFDLTEELKRRIAGGMPVWGTCAGTILLAHRIETETPFLDAIDISVARNAYGRQIDSFQSEQIIPEISRKAVELVFIRAPKITFCGGGVSVLAETNGDPVVVREGQVLATTFHPELTDNPCFHEYFASMI